MLQIRFYPLFVLSYKPKARLRFSASWWSGNKKYLCFCLWQVALYFKVIPNSIEFYKGIFLHFTFFCSYYSCILLDTIRWSKVHENCSYSEFFWCVFSCIQTECAIFSPGAIKYGPEELRIQTVSRSAGRK